MCISSHEIEYFSTFALSTGVVTVGAVEKFTAQVARQLQCVRVVSVEDGLKIIQMLSQMDKLDDEQRKTLSEIVDSKVKDVAVAVAAEQKLNVTHWEHLQSKGDWACYSGPFAD